ncbi:DUF2931 family protein [uncultured Maribacter sp.]|uniref:DUF2931 family protein n=1 Tax=uncultured Maribacter sp. TaxID=431308 RepID=UPI00261A55EC|nr:DUF2931 family protein [uncultured Maribacter sp.]
MKSFLILTSVVVIILIGVFLFFNTYFFSDDKTYNWNIEITKPSDYQINLKNITYFKNKKILNRYSSMNAAGTEWSGANTGRVLHNKKKDYLPDTVNITWEEEKTGILYTTNFIFPMQKVLDLWKKNNTLLKKKWGENYAEGQLSMKIGLGPNGLVVLWINLDDIYTAEFSLEVDTFYATSNTDENKMNTSFGIFQDRFGAPHFCTKKEGRNEVAILVTYYNGESNTIMLKKENNTLLKAVNSKRGWGLAKSIMVDWFTKEGIGYKSFYKVDLKEFISLNKVNELQSPEIIYLLDTTTLPNEYLIKLKNKVVLELKEEKRENISK